jgi:hypothetical protein
MNPLEQLSDIHLPQQVSAWPLAWGWWLLIIVTLTLIFSMVWVTYCYMRDRRVKKAALKELESIASNDDKVSMQVNQLLKRVALAYFPDAPIAALFGEPWSDFLSAQMPSNKQQEFKQQFTLLQQDLYSPRSSFPAETAIELAKIWLKNSTPPSAAKVQNANRLEHGHV